MPEDYARFVRESNAIENIHVDPPHPLWTDHMETLLLAVRFGEYGNLLEPTAIHRKLMASQPEVFPGELRQVHVRVGGDVKMLRVEYPRYVERLHTLVAKREAPSEGALFDLHHEFEWIHPFIDGNGRTGRILWAHLRVLFRYPLEIIESAERHAYYEAIRQWEAGR